MITPKIETIRGSGVPLRGDDIDTDRLSLRDIYAVLPLMDSASMPLKTIVTKIVIIHLIKSNSKMPLS